MHLEQADPFLERCLSLLLVAGVGMDDIPLTAIGGFRLRDRYVFHLRLWSPDRARLTRRMTTHLRLRLLNSPADELCGLLPCRPVLATTPPPKLVELPPASPAWFLWAMGNEPWITRPKTL